MSLSEQSRGLFHCWVRHFSNSCQQTRKIICSFKYPRKNAGKLWRADWYSMKSGRVTSLSGSRTRALSHHQHSQLENTTACKVGGGGFCVGTGGVRHMIASKQEAEHILKLGMLPVSWANLLLSQQWSQRSC